jgi:hypothetical protein
MWVDELKVSVFSLVFLLLTPKDLDSNELFFLFVEYIAYFFQN